MSAANVHLGGTVPSVRLSSKLAEEGIHTLAAGVRYSWYGAISSFETPSLNSR
jgi:hypothetical protein